MPKRGEIFSILFKKIGLKIYYADLWKSEKYL